MRILLLITNLGKGGAQRVFYDHSIAIGYVHDVEEAVFDVNHDLRVYDTGFLLHSLNSCTWMSKLGPIGRLMSRAVVLRKLVKERGIDVVISHMDGANWVNVLSFSTAKKVLVVHGTVLQDGNVPVIQQWFRKRFIFPWLYNLAEKTVAVSDGIARELALECGVRNVCAIPNFFNIQKIDQMAHQALDIDKTQIFNHPSVLITSGRLAEQKKQLHLLDILASLHRRGMKARLVILGDGDLHKMLVLKSKELGFRTVQVELEGANADGNGDVYFLGYVSNPYQYLARSKLFLFPSAWEGFPLALCEAMISGVTVLSSDCPTGPREILAPGSVRDAYDLREAEWAQNGVLLPMVRSPQDIEVWVDAVEDLLVDVGKRKQLKKNASYSVKALDRDIVVKQWLELIEEVAH